MVPGLIDNHNHIVLLGIRPGHHTPLESATSIADVQATLRTRAQKVPAGEFITSMGGWNPVQFTEKRLPTLAELDAATATIPCWCSRASPDRPPPTRPAAPSSRRRASR